MLQLLRPAPVLDAERMLCTLCVPARRRTNGFDAGSEVMATTQKSVNGVRHGSHRDVRFAIKVTELEPSALGHRTFGASFSIRMDAPLAPLVEHVFDSRIHAVAFAVTKAKQAIDRGLGGSGRDVAGGGGKGRPLVGLSD